MALKKYTLVTALLFPAFMGAWLYEAFNFIFLSFTTQQRIDISQLTLSASLLTHYIVDYLYTFQIAPKRYSSAHFVIDIGILICLYIGLKISISPNYGSMMIGIWVALSVMKLFAVAWTWLEKDYRGMKYDGTFLLIYSISAYFWPDTIWLFVVVCFIDALIYEVDFVQKETKSNK